MFCFSYRIIVICSAARRTVRGWLYRCRLRGLKQTKFKICSNILILTLVCSWIFSSVERLDANCFIMPDTTVAGKEGRRGNGWFDLKPPKTGRVFWVSAASSVGKSVWIRRGWVAWLGEDCHKLELAGWLVGVTKESRGEEFHIFRLGWIGKLVKVPEKPGNCRK